MQMFSQDDLASMVPYINELMISQQLRLTTQGEILIFLEC